MNRHRCVAFFPPAAPRSEAASVPKGLSAPAPDLRRADPPAPDGAGAGATDPCPGARPLAGDGGGPEARRLGAPGHAARPLRHPRARAPRRRAPGSARTHAGSAGHPRRSRCPDRPPATSRPAGIARAAGPRTRWLGSWDPSDVVASETVSCPVPTHQVPLASDPPPGVYWRRKGHRCQPDRSFRARAPPRPQHRRHLSRPPQALAGRRRETTSRPGSRGGHRCAPSAGCSSLP
jgi:hypothetical protein